jgi:hypothetical protein
MTKTDAGRIERGLQRIKRMQKSGVISTSDIAGIRT